MSIHLVTGRGTGDHVTSADAGSLHAGIVGTGRYVLNRGSQFAYEVISNNLVKIKDGDLLNQGRHMNIAVNDYEECTIENGLQSVKRNDLIVIRYEKNTETEIESASVVVIKGTSGDTAVDPEYITGNILSGDTTDDFPLYRVRLNGLNIEGVDGLFAVNKSLVDLEEYANEKLEEKVGKSKIISTSICLSQVEEKGNVIDALLARNMYGRLWAKTGKNLLNNSVTTGTNQGVTITLNSDKSVTLSGTATGGDSKFVLNQFTYVSGYSYIMTGCPSGGSTSTYFLESDSHYDTGSGVNLDWGNSSSRTTSVAIVVKQGVTVSNLKFLPMIRYADVTDSVYEACCLSVPEVYGQLNTHRTSADHDSRYNTKSETSALLSNMLSNLYTTKTVTTSLNVAANSSQTYNLTVPSVTGYTPVGTTFWSAGSTSLFFAKILFDGTTLDIAVRNISTSAISSGTLSVGVLYLKNSF